METKLIEAGFSIRFGYEFGCIAEFVKDRGEKRLRITLYVSPNEIWLSIREYLREDILSDFRCEDRFENPKEISSMINAAVFASNCY